MEPGRQRRQSGSGGGSSTLKVVNLKVLGLLALGALTLTSVFRILHLHTRWTWRPPSPDAPVSQPAPPAPFPPPLPRPLPYSACLLAFPSLNPFPCPCGQSIGAL